MIISWTVYDLLRAVGHVVAGGSARTAIRGLIFGGLATLLLWGGVLLSDDGAGRDLWSLMTFSDAQLLLWMAAGILRLWMYPFHLSAPDDLGAAPSLAAPLFLSPVLGWGLWIRLVLANSGYFPGGTWVLINAMGALAVGGFMAWSCEDVRQVLLWVGMGTTGVVLFAAGLAGDGAIAVIVAGSTVWAMGVALLSLKDGLQQGKLWWSLPSFVGALALLGSPLTLGFVVEASLIEGLMEAGHIGWGGVFFFGNLFLVPSLVRWLLLPSLRPVLNRHGLLVARGVGLGLLALPLVVAGLYPPFFLGDISVPSLGTLLVMPGIRGWLLWVISLFGGGLLAWQEGALRAKIEPLLGATHELLRLEWLYDAVLGAVDRGLGVLRMIGEVVGGAGALLWSWLLFLLFLLIWGRP
jgi:formate hydrogenlyase subunit 3/multisubunit Na+/H+ antiporter MnhD subunit